MRHRFGVCAKDATVFPGGVCLRQILSEELNIAESVELLAAGKYYFKCSFVEVVTNQKMFWKALPKDPTFQSFSANLTLFVYR